MRLETLLAPDSRDVVPGHGDALGLLQVFCQLARRPVRKPRAVRRCHACQRDHPGPHPRRHLFPGSAGPVTFQPGQSDLGITPLPAVHCRQRHPKQCGNVLASTAFTRPQHDPAPRRYVGGYVPAVDQLPQHGGLFLGELHTKRPRHTRSHNANGITRH